MAVALCATKTRLASTLSYVFNKKQVFTMPKFDFKGIIATAFTPFHNDVDQSLNLSVIPEIAEHFKKDDLKCVLINGTYGEGMAMTTDERIQVANAWAEAAKKTKQQLIIQVGGTNLQDVRRLAKHAQSIKASALLCLPELYYKPKTVEDLIDYLKVVGEAAPDTPLFYYHSPLVTGVTLTMDELFAKVKDQVPSFAGVKFAVAQLDDLSRAMRQAAGKFQIIMASNHNMPLYIKMGIDTFMPTAINVNATVVNKIYEAATGGPESYQKAQDCQKYWSHCIDALSALNCGNAAPPMKAVTTQLWKIHLGPSRKPLRSFDTLEERDKISNFISDVYMKDVIVFAS